MTGKRGSTPSSGQSKQLCEACVKMREKRHSKNYHFDPRKPKYCPNHSCPFEKSPGVKCQIWKSKHAYQCSEHYVPQCNTGRCLEVTVNDSNFCPRHLCRKEYCKLGRDERLPFCQDHMCSKKDCNECRFGLSFFCPLDACTYQGCQKEARPSDGILYCPDHKCTDPDCDALKKHIEWQGLLHMVAFCSNHECLTPPCRARKAPGKGHCALHCCTKQNCQSYRQGDLGGTFCLHHHNDLIRDQSKEKLSAQLRAQEAAERHRLDAIERRRQEEAERADAEHRYQAEQESLCQERQRREDEQVQATIEQEERRKQNEEARIERGRQKAQNQARATDEAEARKEQEIEEARDVERRNRNKRAEEARIHAEEIFRQQQQREDEDKIRRQHQCENEERIRLQDEERLQRREREERKKREQIDRHLAERSRDTVGDYEDIRLRPVVNFAYTEPKPRQREDIRSRTQSVYEYERDEAYMSASPEGSPRGQTRGHSARVSESGSGISAANIFDDGDEFVAPRRSTPYIVKPYIGSRADSRPPKKKGIWDD